MTLNFQSLLAGEVWRTEATAAEARWGKSLDSNQTCNCDETGYLSQRMPPKDCIFHDVTQDWRPSDHMTLVFSVDAQQRIMNNTDPISWGGVSSIQFVEGLLKCSESIMGTGSMLFLLLHPTIHLLLPLTTRAACIHPRFIPMYMPFYNRYQTSALLQVGWVALQLWRWA